MTKYFFVSNQYSPYVVGGAEITVQTLAEGLVARGNTAVVCSLAPPGSQASKETLNGVSIHRIPVQNVPPVSRQASR